jgi:hypothetical protein
MWEVAHSVIRPANILSTSAGLGAAGVGATPIQANGEVYGLERVGDVSGAFVRAAQNNVGGLWLRTKNGVIIHIEAPEAVPLFPAGDAVIIKLNQ